MFHFIRNWFDLRILRRSGISPAQWAQAFAALPLLRGLGAEEKHGLQQLATLFCHRKLISGAHGLVVTRDMQLIIALQACLPVLHLGLETYQGWVEVIVYPSGFAPKRVIRDDYGVEHFVQDELSGEAWQTGPVLLAWDETERAGVIDGHNLVIHEFAHKLDMQNGVANGFPPLHPGMDRVTWTAAFSAAYEDLCDSCDAGVDLGIDCYASTSPAEFFAVLSEVFFEQPDLVQRHYRAVYEQLRLYYRQDPLLRLRQLGLPPFNSC